jgi:lipopolysaccharide export system protein LptC
VKDRWLAYVPALLLAGLAGLTYWLDQAVQPAGPARDGGSRHDPDLVVENFTATRMHLDGTPRYAVAARRMLHYPDNSTTELEYPELTHYDTEEGPVTIRANQGLLSENGEDAYFTGDVRVRRAAHGEHQEMSLYTSFLHVIPDQDLAKTDREVTMTSGNSTAKSVGLEFNNKARTVKLLSQVSVSYQTPEKGSALPWERRQ